MFKYMKQGIKQSASILADGIVALTLIIFTTHAYAQVANGQNPQQGNQQAQDAFKAKVQSLDVETQARIDKAATVLVPARKGGSSAAPSAPSTPTAAVPQTPPPQQPTPAPYTGFTPNDSSDTSTGGGGSGTGFGSQIYH